MDDYLTNLSWLKLPIPRDLRSNKVECANHDIDDDLQCLCWLDRVRPRSSSHLLKRVPRTNKKSRQTNRFLSSTETYKDNLSSFRGVSMTRTWNNPLLVSRVSHDQSLILIRLSNGKMFCLSIDQNCH